MARSFLFRAGFPPFLAAVLLLVAVPASAEDASVTLAASPTAVEPGQSTQLSGTIAPASSGQTVSIVEQASGEQVHQATTDGQGAYSATFTPDRSVTIVAKWNGATSEPVRIDIRADAQVALDRVLLFGDASARGQVSPAPESGAIDIAILRGGVLVETVTAPVTAGGTFVASFPVELPGTYVAEVRTSEQGAPSARSGGRRTPLPRLQQGARGEVVKLAEQRLRDLGYRIAGVNAVFDERTGDAVLAFHKVHGMERTSVVTRATWQRLARPIDPKVQSRAPGIHVEIDQTKQVLYLVRSGEIQAIVHTSTGANGATRDGIFVVHSKTAGYSPNRLYYPSYFDGTRAVHGWPEVPTYPASHGCSRVPNWTAVWLFDRMPIGTEVRVYHSGNPGGPGE